MAPFIVRGVTLAGIDFVMAPKAKRLSGFGKAGPGPRPPKARGDDETRSWKDVRDSRRDAWPEAPRTVEGSRGAFQNASAAREAVPDAAPR